jgi:hypothetical protein
MDYSALFGVFLIFVGGGLIGYVVGRKLEARDWHKRAAKPTAFIRNPKTMEEWKKRAKEVKYYVCASTADPFDRAYTAAMLTWDEHTRAFLPPMRELQDIAIAAGKRHAKAEKEQAAVKDQDVNRT